MIVGGLAIILVLFGSLAQSIYGNAHFVAELVAWMALTGGTM